MLMRKMKLSEAAVQIKLKLQKIDKRKRIILGIFILLMIVSAWYGITHLDMREVLHTLDALPEPLKYLSIIVLTSLQIFLAFLPGEPLELASGYLFGAWQGTLLCMIGSFIGTMVVYMIVKVFRHGIIDVMFDPDKVNEMGDLLASKKGMIWMFILFLIPGSPKDIMTYLVSLGNVQLCKWLALTTIGRIPSIVTSTFLSDSLREGDILMAVMIGILTLILVVVGTLVYKKIVKSTKCKEKSIEML